MGFFEESSSSVLLLDNGSLLPASTLCLRRIAEALSRRAGAKTEAVSLLHSSAVARTELDGTPAEVFEPAVRIRYGAGIHEFLVLPLFFGPSGALTSYLPKRIARLQEQLPDLRVRVGQPLVDPKAAEDIRLAKILADHVHEAWSEARVSGGGRVILVDHGSPEQAVAAARERVTALLQTELADTGAEVTAASMERRPGFRYDFNEPLLRSALEKTAAEATRHAKFDEPGRTRHVTVAMLFFSPGRHAGPGGDIETICRAVEEKFPNLRTLRTKLVGEHPLLIEILADHLGALMSAGSANGQTAD